jgi:HPt (histidine-containing phosphotransfer) domain-containing protein
MDALDRDVIDNLRQLQSPGETNPLHDLIPLYLADAKNRFEIIDAALATKDGARLAASTHSLKGSSNNLGARMLGELCGQVEKLAKSDRFDAAAELVPSVRREFDRVREALQREIQ